MAAAQPYRLAVLADFACGPGAARAVELDLDNHDTFLAAFRPKLELGLEFCGALDLARASDLHPDGLCRNVLGLSALLEARAAAGDPRRLEALLSEAGASLELEAEPIATSSVAAPAPASDSALLDSLLGAPRAAERDTDPVRRLARSLGEAASARGDRAGVERTRRAVERELAARVRLLLAHPELRRLDALCRGLRRLVRLAPDPERVRVYAVHAPPAEPERAAPALDGMSFVLADLCFDDGAESRARLETLGKLAQALRVPLLASADAICAGAGGFADASWQELRASEWARRVGLCTPRALARLPYGASTEPIESFAFEELAAAPQTSDFSWCNAALVAGRALVEAASATGDAAAWPRASEPADLPVYSAQRHGVREHQTALEREWHEREAESLAARGLCALVAERGSDRAQLRALRSLGGTALV